MYTKNVKRVWKKLDIKHTYLRNTNQVFLKCENALKKVAYVYEKCKVC